MKFLLLFVLVAVLAYFLIYRMRSQERLLFAKQAGRWLLPVLIAAAAVTGALFLAFGQTLKVF